MTEEITEMRNQHQYMWTLCWCNLKALSPWDNWGVTFRSYFSISNLIMTSLNSVFLIRQNMNESGYRKKCLDLCPQQTVIHKCQNLVVLYWTFDSYSTVLATYTPSLKKFAMPPEPNRVVIDQVTDSNYAPSLKKFVMAAKPNRVVVDQVTTQIMPPVSKSLWCSQHLIELWLIRSPTQIMPPVSKSL